MTTKIETALLEAVGLPSSTLVTSMILVCKPKRLPVLEVELVLTPITLESISEPVFKSFTLVDISEQEPTP